MKAQRWMNTVLLPTLMVVASCAVSSYQVTGKPEPIDSASPPYSYRKDNKVLSLNYDDFDIDIEMRNTVAREQVVVAVVPTPTMSESNLPTIEIFVTVRPHAGNANLMRNGLVIDETQFALSSDGKDQSTPLKATVAGYVRSEEGRTRISGVCSILLEASVEWNPNKSYVLSGGSMKYGDKGFVFPSVRFKALEGKKRWDSAP